MIRSTGPARLSSLEATQPRKTRGRAVTALLFALVGVAACFADPALAGPRASAPAPNWTGFYLGGDVGAARGASSYSFADPGNSGFFACGPCGGPWDPQNPNASNTAWVAGAHLGFNWQASPLWLVGIEGDFNSSGIRISSNTALTQPFGTFPGSSVAFQTYVKWLASVRGRLGLTRDNWLVYATGGVAWADMSFKGSAGCPITVCPLTADAFSASATRTGFVVGGGAEWQLPNSKWRARAEYLYYGFDATAAGSGVWNSVFTPPPFDCGPGGSSGVCRAKYGFGGVNIQTLRFGLSYALN